MRVFLLCLLLLPRVVHAQQSPPVADAIPFVTGETAVNKGIVQRIEFDRDKANITLKNTTAEFQDVHVTCYVLNKDGIIIWETQEAWAFTQIAPAAKYAKDYDFMPHMPHDLQFMPGAARIDLTPRWVVFR